MVDSPLQTPDQPTPAQERRRNNAAGVELAAIGKANLQLHSLQPGRRNILFVTFDLVKTGGLGKVSAALPRALVDLHDVAVLAALLGRGDARGWLPLRPGDPTRGRGGGLRRAPARSGLQ